MDLSQLFTNPLLARAEPNCATQAYEDVIIYDGTDEDDVLYEGPIQIYPNGWLELEGNRLLSPSAVHHIDIYDDVDLEDEEDQHDDRREQWDRRDGDGLSGWEDDDGGLW